MDFDNDNLNINDNDVEDDERSSLYLLSTLFDDYMKCYKMLLDDLERVKSSGAIPTSDDTAFSSRLLVRAGFAYIEGAVSYLKY